MKIKKTWATLEFIEGDAMIECNMNYETGKFSLTHGSNDNNVTFRDEDIETCLRREKCVKAALLYIKSEFKL
jgi:hypothetical protein